MVFPVPGGPWTTESSLDGYISVTNSSSRLSFLKIRAESGQIFNKNPGETKFCDSFYDLGHVQTGILTFGEQLHNASNVH